MLYWLLFMGGVQEAKPHSQRPPNNSSPLPDCSVVM
jgi:hypothetical protein